MQITAAQDLRGIGRLMASSPVGRFLGVGVASTVAYALLYLLLRRPLGPAGANALALALTAVANTAANRRLTFGIRGRAGLLRQHAAGAAVFVLTLALTNLALVLLHRAPRPIELAGLVLASLAATITRYVALRTWVFRSRRRRPASVGSAPAWPS